MATLKDAMPRDFSEYDKSWKYAEVEVVKEHCSVTEDAQYIRWPGPHKHVHFWVELANGVAVGWNENPSVGYSFPAMKIKKVEQ